MNDITLIYQQIADMIADLSSIDLEQINPDSILDEELFLTDLDLQTIAQQIHRQWPDVKLSLADLSEADTVQDLVGLVVDELELG